MIWEREGSLITEYFDLFLLFSRPQASRFGKIDIIITSVVRHETANYSDYLLDYYEKYSQAYTLPRTQEALGMDHHRQA
jgi:hypothetical protein